MVHAACCAVLGICLGSAFLHVVANATLSAGVAIITWLGLGYASRKQHLLAAEDENKALRQSNRAGWKCLPDTCLCCPPGGASFPAPKRRSQLMPSQSPRGR